MKASKYLFLVKYFASVCFLWLSFVPLHAQTDLNGFLDQTDQFLQKYVKEGKVDYPAIIKSPAELKALVQAIANFSLDGLSDSERKAFYINAYNLNVIDGIVQHYPTNSPQAVVGFFDREKHQIAGESLTLNELEKDKLLKTTQDARLHFVLVCAAKSCPPLAPEAYRPENLEEQLDIRTRMALDDPKFIRVENDGQKVEISELFTWYRGDFLRNHDSVLDFINAYRSEKLDSEIKVGTYTYDWSLNIVKEMEDDMPLSPNPKGRSNLQVFTPSALFRKGQFEINFFNNLYTQTEVRNTEGDEIGLAQRQNFLSTMIQFTYGVSKSARVNVGLDLHINSASVDLESGSPFKHFFGEVDFRETVISYIAPRVKFVPFKKFPRVSVQSSLWIPIADDLENRDGRFIAHDRYTWLTQFFSDFSLGPKFQVFIEEAIFYRINRNSQQDNNFVRFFLSGFLSYFPTSKTTIFGFAQYAPRYETLDNGFDSQFGLSQWFTQVGLGAKYQLTPQVGLELSYGNFIASRRDGAGSAINFGVRFIK